MGTPRLSIITPSYNQSEFIEDNLESVLKQDYEDVEHIVVDGGSDDRTVEILKRYEEEYDLRWVSEEDRGQAHALNKGLSMAEGDWIGWQNSDDYYAEGSFETLDRTLSTHPDADVVYGDIVIVDRGGREVDRAYHIQPSRFVQRYANIMANQAFFFRKEVVEAVGEFDEDYYVCIDTDFFWRLTRSDLKLVHVPEFLGYFRTYEEAKTGGEKTERHRSERDRIQRMYGVPIYERVLPRSVLRGVALAVKAGYLLADGRTEAFGQRLGDAL